MKKTAVLFTLALSLLMLLSGCGRASPTDSAPVSEPAQADGIAFSGDQLYAVALVGFDDLTELPFYLDNYVHSDSVPIHYFSAGEYYLIIPRYSDMDLKLYQNDMTADSSTLVFAEQDCAPFLIQCNISDIFSDATISITYDQETVAFSPYVSLKDGSIQIGAQGLNLTK
ncbi:MAG: hypothetical protein PHD32_12115 [Eubacteriales bacterium]|nr:hypothetical protein [Eubacteriales bacterium]